MKLVCGDNFLGWRRGDNLFLDIVIVYIGIFLVIGLFMIIGVVF